MPCACPVPFLFPQGLPKKVGLKKGRLGPNLGTDIDFPSRYKQFSWLKVQLWPPALLSDVPRGLVVHLTFVRTMHSFGFVRILGLKKEF